VAAELQQIFWSRVRELLGNDPRRVSRFWKSLNRNKNTLTKWRKGLSDVSLSDIEEIAGALGVDASHLLDGDDARQLQLPFPAGRAQLELELSWRDSVLTLRKAPSRETSWAGRQQVEEGEAGAAAKAASSA
jgi:transcriptional regulator with XRE-family HTH domain